MIRSRQFNYHEFFTYTDEQWDQIKTVVRDRLGRDANQIEHQDPRGHRHSKGIQSLRGSIETAALLHIRCSEIESRPGYKARIKRLTTLRNRAKALRRDLILAINTEVTTEDFVYSSMRGFAHMIEESERAIDKLERMIEACIAAQRPQPTANTNKIGRDRFWNEALAIWVIIGGDETGIAAAEFLRAVSKPVFRRVRAIRGHKTTASMPLNSKSVVEWLRLRAKARQVATS